MVPSESTITKYPNGLNNETETLPLSKRAARKINNKHSRKIAAIVSKRIAKSKGPQEHFVSGITSKDSRQKPRRYSYVAHITFPPTVQTTKNEEGEIIDTKEVGERYTTVKLDRIMITNSKDALETCHTEEESLRENVPNFRDCKIVIEAQAQETVSDTMISLVQGYQDMARIYHLALNLSSEKLLNLERRVSELEHPVVTEVVETPVPFTNEDIEKKTSEFYMTAVKTLQAADKVRQDAKLKEKFEADIAAQVALEQATDSAQAEEPKRKLGVDAYEEIMADVPSTGGEQTQ